MNRSMRRCWMCRRPFVLPPWGFANVPGRRRPVWFCTEVCFNAWRIAQAVERSS